MGTWLSVGKEFETGSETRLWAPGLPRRSLEPWLPWKSKVLCRYVRKVHPTLLSRAASVSVPARTCRSQAWALGCSA